MLFTTPGLGEFISGVILFDETIRQKIGRRFDAGSAHAVGSFRASRWTRAPWRCPAFAGEKITQGLDGLRERLAAYRELGARFTKWRAVIAIGERLPTAACIEANARALALFRGAEPGSRTGADRGAGSFDGRRPHAHARCEEVTNATLKPCLPRFYASIASCWRTMLLKTGMVLPGKDCPQQAEVGEVAEATLRCLRRAVPAAVPGIVFLSGGQSDVAATERLNAICRAGGAPWTLSFSFGRALQDAALKTWKGSPANVAAAQAALHHRAKCNSLAVQGKVFGGSGTRDRFESSRSKNKAMATQIFLIRHGGDGVVAHRPPHRAHRRASHRQRRTPRGSIPRGAAKFQVHPRAHESPPTRPTDLRTRRFRRRGAGGAGPSGMGLRRLRGPHECGHSRAATGVESI